ncbi:hypothetical protein [Zhongshania sp.]|jgi:hypothetical protein|uniref:hypothetical protein n=1 Tax=Zhongshania sp. TaxID=1971902 RepID=UPI0039E42E06
MKIKLTPRSIVLSVMLGLAGSANAIELSILGGVDGGLGVLDTLPLAVGGIKSGLLINSGIPVLMDLPVIGELPLIDGRGIPVIGDLGGGSMLVSGLVQVIGGDPNLNGGLPIIGNRELVLFDLLEGGPTLNFLALDAVVPL